MFVTAYPKYAVDAFDVRAVDYVLKPFDRQRIAKALERAAEFVNDSAQAAKGRRPVGDKGHSKFPRTQ